MSRSGGQIRNPSALVAPVATTLTEPVHLMSETAVVLRTASFVENANYMHTV